MIRNILDIIGTLMIAASCQQEIAAVRLPETEREITLRPISNTPTRAAIDGTAFPVSRTLTVSAYNNGTNENYFNNTTFAYHPTTDSWGGTSPKYWPLTGSLDLLAFSADGLSTGTPAYGTKVTESVTLTIPDNSTIETDILHGHAPAQTKQSTGNPIQMKHAQALLVFTAKATESYEATTNRGITLTKITVKDAYYSGTLAISATEDPSDGYCRWTSLGNKKNKNLPGLSSYNVPSTAMDISSNGMGIGGAGIMVPEQTQTSVTVEYTLHNGKSESSTNIDFNLTYSFNLSGDWQEGKKYHYLLDFTLNEIRITPYVLDWNAESATHIIPDPANGHEYIDLGLRETIGGIEHKVLFATKNIGADNPQDYGNFYMWADTEVRYTNLAGYDSDKGDFSMSYSNMPYHTGSGASTGYLKYIPSSKTSYWAGEGSPDNLLTLEAIDDAATILWGGQWRMPDIDELGLLLSSTVNRTWVTDWNSTGVAGLLITGKGEYSSATLFLPAAGSLYNKTHYDEGVNSYIWSRNVYTSNPGNARYLYCSETDNNLNNHRRCSARSIRPVLVIPE